MAVAGNPFITYYVCPQCGTRMDFMCDMNDVIYAHCSGCDFYSYDYDSYQVDHIDYLFNEGDLS